MTKNNEPVAWMDEFGNVFPLAAWSGKIKSYLDRDYENWKPVYASPQVNNDFDFQVGDKVEKCTGDYHLGGVVVGHAVTLKGKVRYVVEHAPLAPGMLHIYSSANLRKL